MVFLTRRSDPEVAARCASDGVLFLEYGSRDIRGLELKATRDLHEIARSRDFRFCIAHRFKPIWIVSLAAHPPVIGIYHTSGDYQRSSRKVFVGLMSRHLSLLVVSDAVCDNIRRYLPKWLAERTETLYNCIDVAALQTEQVERLSARRQLRLPDGAWVIGNIDRLHPDRNQATLLRGFAAASLRPSQSSLSAVLSSGCLEERLKDLACGLGIGGHVLSLGQVKEARRYFKALDAFIPSSDHEPFSIVLLEAMVAGVSLVATVYGGAREVVEGVGILLPLDDETTLVEGLTHLAVLDRRQHEACVRLMLECLETCLFDIAVRREFWRPPTITDFTSESAC